MIKRSILAFLVVSFVATFFLIVSQDAQAIRVSLRRVIFEGAKKSEVLTIINTTSEEQTYRLGWRKYRMDEDKPLHSIEDAEDDGSVMWADKLVRFAPQRVKVPAGGTQQIRILLRRPKDLAAGEYRSHLWIVTEGKPEKFSLEQRNDNQQAIKLAIQPAISLPIFVRNGKLSATANISGAKLTKIKSGLNIKLTLNREGDKSIYGDFDFTCTDGGTNTVLRQVRGIAVYTEINKRHFDFDLPLTDTKLTTCRAMDIQFRADPEDPVDKGAVLAKTSVTL
jgi:P pilus assembly chaperone PapD